VQEYFDQHGDELMTPERVRLEYVHLAASALSKDIATDEAELEAYYEQKKESLQTLEQRRASHILIKVAADAEDDAVDEARKEAEALLVRIRDGEDFSELARQYSDDPGSAENGGDLGYFGKGAMVPEFEKTVFALEKGDVSEPVRTQFGFHLIMLVEVQGSEIPSLDQVREELIAELQKHQIDDLFYEKLEQLTDLSYESPDSLVSVEEVMGLEVQTSDWLTAAGGPGIGAYPQLRAVAFSDDVLEAGNNSEPVEVEDGDVFVVRVAEREPAQRPPLENVKDQIIATLKKQHATEQARAAGEALLQKISQGASMEDLRGDDVVTLNQAKGVERSTPGYNPEIMRAAFRLPRPAPGETIEHGMQLANGDYAVIRLTKISDGDPGAMQEKSRQQIVQSYESLRQAVNFSTLVENLRSRADIVIPSEQEE
jgi:peptidyl-prolyl cis-trans isomerase D